MSIAEKLNDIKAKLHDPMTETMWTSMMESLCKIRKDHNQTIVDESIMYMQTNKTNLDALLVACILNNGIVFSDERSLDEITDELYAELTYLKD